MNELIEKIINDEELSNEEKTILIKKVVNASHQINRFITPGFYLHTDIRPDESIDMQLWYRNVDENGTTEHGPTDWDSDKIIRMMKEEYLNKDKLVR